MGWMRHCVQGLNGYTAIWLEQKFDCAGGSGGGINPRWRRPPPYREHVAWKRLGPIHAILETPWVSLPWLTSGKASWAIS